MSTEAELREQVATLTRIFAMRGLLGLHGHITGYDPETGRIYMCPGLGADKATTRPEDLFVIDREGQVLEGQGRLPIEWPIHTALHAVRPDARAVAHLHAPYATLFAVTRRTFQPVIVAGRPFGDGVPTYPRRQLITTPDQGREVAAVVGDGCAALLRGHGVVIASSDLPELLYTAVILEENARAAVQAAALGELDFVSREEFDSVEAATPMKGRAQMAWNYFVRLEARWDRQPPFGTGALG
jgi:L-fuculose-phosphate aldolase